MIASVAGFSTSVLCTAEGVGCEVAFVALRSLSILIKLFLCNDVCVNNVYVPASIAAEIIIKLSFLRRAWGDLLVVMLEVRLFLYVTVGSSTLS